MDFSAVCAVVILVSAPGAGRAAEPAATAQAGDPTIRKIVGEISAKNIEATIKKLVSFGTRHTLSDQESPTHGIGAARDWVKAEMESYSKASGGRLKVEFDEFVQEPTPRVPKAVKIANVVATLPGTKADSKDRIYVVSGHLDSRCSDGLDATTDAPGANDDGSGTAAVMEMARVMSKYEFDATLVFLAVSGEEQGLLGASHWAKAAAEKKLDIQGMITNDIIGSSHGDAGQVDASHVRLFAEGVPAGKELAATWQEGLKTSAENDSPSRSLARVIREYAEADVPGFHVTVVYRRDRYLRGGDHIPFLQNGFPAVRMTEPAEDFHHQHQNVREEKGVKFGDTVEFVDFDYIANVARVNAAGLAGLALAPAPPKDVEIETMQLENDTTLRWKPSAEADLAGYRIVWRETTSAFWEHTADAGNVQRFTVKGVSKDNVIFGVEAVDKDGHASAASYPKPVREVPTIPTTK